MKNEDTRQARRAKATTSALRPIDLAAEARTGIKSAQKFLYHPELRAGMQPVVRMRLEEAETRLLALQSK